MMLVDQNLRCFRAATNTLNLSGWGTLVVACLGRKVVMFDSGKRVYLRKYKGILFLFNTADWGKDKEGKWELICDGCFNSDFSLIEILPKEETRYQFRCKCCGYTFNRGEIIC